MRQFSAIFFSCILFVNATLYSTPHAHGNSEFSNSPRYVTWAYSGGFGDKVRKLLSKKWPSVLVGKFANWRISRFAITPYKKLFKISQQMMDDFKQSEKGFPTLNAFFARELKDNARPQAHTDLIAPADGAVSMFTTSQEKPAIFKVKETEFQMSSFLKNEALALNYANSSIVIFRLAPSDYHRYHAPCDGTITQIIDVNGKYESVDPIVYSKKIPVLSENHRQIIEITTKEGKKLLLIIVGAMFVGSIHSTKKVNDVIKKGDELGYFTFGGSTVVLVAKNDVVTFEPHILRHSNQFIETPIKMNEALGSFKK